MPILRAATEQDAAGIAALLAQLGYPSDEEAVAIRLANLERAGGYGCFVADLDGRIVGMVATSLGWYIEKDGAYVRIVALVVDEPLRQRGLGSALLDLAEQWAAERGAGVMMLNAGAQRQEAQDFYRHRGYASTGQRFVKTIASRS
ncbi:GNAT family N-acetyltransferase [Chitiniphilus purpureus]|uniref:GNAT family N-acetyltransferase n=1 Tax=Chitiniphilus purpureus TaxID=2981137 RepID=A0ABY6DLK8_9NEIS|nr:GNAT family N-acetyltransferase [Chitiniphilus sp. CD1]UXY15239.1 GNAT family N-acetyltransferase [Chitiniphilus sp. CD1]